MDTTNTNIRDGALGGPWQQVATAGTRQAGPQVCDCLVVGAGITGITTALLLQEAGKQVIVAEAHTIGFGTTGGTSAHINNFADTTFAEAKSAFGEDGAQLFADAIREGFELVRTHIDRLKIACDYEPKTGYLYAENKEEAKQLDEIREGMQQVGIKANYVDKIPSPVPFQKALEIPGQAQFHPVKYLRALAAAFVAAGGVIVEHTFIEQLEQADGIHIVNGTIRARKVIYATHVPPGITVFSFRCAPYRSYVLALKLKSGKYPDAVIYDSQEPYHYVRTHRIGGEDLLLVGGHDHKTGHDDPEKAFAALDKYARQYYSVASVKYRWSSQYYIPADGFPYVGQIPFAADGILTATGFNGNGMMLGSVSAKILADSVLSIENPYAALFSPSRIKPIDGFLDLVKENADVAYHFIADRFGIPETDSVNRLHPGTGRIVELDGERLAVYKDDAGAVHALNPTCTHAGCIVGFNAAECTWDCPCHGGRFAIDGSVLTGPPTKALQQIQIDLKNNTIMPTKNKNQSSRSPEAESALKELFTDELKDIYWAEKHLASALPKLIKGATSEDLKQTITNHLEETKSQVTRLESVFESIGEKAAAKKCLAMEGLLKEATELLSDTDKGTEVRDVAIISAAQKVEHYEIASYGTLRTLAGTLGYSEAQALLDETLAEEKNADQLLTQVAENYVNEAAAQETE